MDNELEKSTVLNDIRKNYNLDINIARYGNAIDEVGLWESEKIICDKYINKNDKILDLGCGAGRTTINLFKRGYKNIIGLDLSDELIKCGKDYCTKNNLNVDLVIGDAMNLKYEDNNFESVIFSYNGMMCIPGHKNRVKVLEEVYRVLKPNGIYIFTAHNRDDSGRHNEEWAAEKLLWEQGKQNSRLEMFGDKYPVDITGETIFLHFSNIEELQTLVESVGFEVLEHTKSTNIAHENEKTREFAGVTVFWVLRKK